MCPHMHTRMCQFPHHQYRICLGGDAGEDARTKMASTMKRQASAIEHDESAELTKLKRTAEAHLDKFRSGTQKGLATLQKTLHSLEEAAQGTAKEEEAALFKIAEGIRTLKKQTKQLAATRTQSAGDAHARANAACNKLTDDALQELHRAVFTSSHEEDDGDVLE